ncbi:hypothetical protein BA894_21670 [Vibrio natriegens]|uniref:DVUA0089 family protein n=1 Tax=Vibrio natriegens TaxID=691 RepID=UPI00080407CD|nr:DVUA0089 family protein [Vibrio natriegens]ANQ29010.1 hypothetical protein BA894_21670 [Vibrio natriegens]
MKSQLTRSGLAISIASVLSVLSNPAIALPNGKPFQELSSAIETNAEAITALQVDVSEINANITNVYSVLDEMDGRVSKNAQDISAALLRISANEGDIDVLQSDIGLLRGQLLDAIDAMEAEMSLIRENIRDLVSENEKLAAELAAAVLELTASIDENSAQIDTLETKVNLLTASVATNNTRISALENRVDDMGIEVTTNKDDIAQMVAALAALKEKVDVYHDECLEEITYGDTVTGELVADSECLSVSRPQESPGLYYQFTLFSTTRVAINALGLETDDGTLSDPYLYLHSGDRNGEVIDSDDDSGQGFNARITRTLQPGTYTVELTNYNPSQYGTYTLTVN